MNSTIEAICRKIDQQNPPEDRILFYILADALEDIGNRRSEGIRWLIENSKNPHFFKTPFNSLIKNNAYSWCPEQDHNIGWHPTLPRKIINYMQNSSADWRDYLTLSSAMLAAAEAYVLFKDSEQ